jgi:hypothetical protein
VSQVKDHGRGKVVATLILSLTKTAEVIGASLSKQALITMATDLVDKYSHDSIEDIMQALKKGRSGNYGTVYRFNLPTVGDWMSAHLEEKSQVREEAWNRFKDTKKGEAPIVNPEELDQAVIPEGYQEPEKTEEELEAERIREEFYRPTREKMKRDKEEADQLAEAREKHASDLGQYQTTPEGVKNHEKRIEAHRERYRKEKAKELDEYLKSQK